MDPLELELRRTLTRREPASDFTSRVMEEVRRESAEERTEQKVIAFEPRRSQRYWRWAAVGALAASLTIGVVVEQRRNSRRQAEAAEAQLYETLLLVGEKMNQARAEIRGSQPEGVVQ
jgi:DUF917 family protein